MKNLKFKTNFSCSGCLATGAIIPEETTGEKNWNVDIKIREKKLTALPVLWLKTASLLLLKKQALMQGE